MAALRGSDLSTAVPAEQLELAQAQVNSYWSVAWYDSLLSFIERVFALVTQIALAILVLQTFIRKQLRWLGLAILWHALLDAVAVYTIGIWNVYIVESIIGIFAIASLGIIFALRQAETAEVPEPIAPDVPIPIQATDLPPIEVTGENINSTRYEN
jgi:uncharacterized membrane protein YhfC